ncbi:MAG: hypothetical protein ACYC4U_32085 [Pirellulaceae bacterium]
MLESHKLTFVVLGIGLAVGGEASEPLDIPSGPDAPSANMFLAQRREFHERMVVGAFDAIGQHDDRWSKAARHFLELWVDWTANDDPHKGLPGLRTAGKVAIEAGCDDPMVHFLYGRILAMTQPAAEWLPFVQKAYEGLAVSKYGVLYHFWAAYACQLAYEELGQRESAARYKTLTFDLLLKTICSDDYRPNEQRLLLSHVALDGMALNEKAQLLVALQNLQGVGSWLKNMIRGKLEIDLAWNARGGDWASEVPDEAWKGFGEHLQIAYEALLAAWQSDPHAPEPAVELITVAMAGATPPDQGPRYWFDRAVSAEYDCIRAYQLYRQTLLPRWGGSIEQLYAFGNECLATQRFDSRVPWEFFEIVKTIATDFHGDREFFERPGVYEDLAKMIDGYLAQAGGPESQDWNRNFAVAVAWRCKRWEEGRRYAGQISGGPNTDAFSRVNVEPELALGEIDARTGEWSQKLGEAETLFIGGKYDLAADAYRALLATMPESQPAAGFVRDGLRNAEILERFRAGEWIDVLPDLHGSQWTVGAGDWTVDDEGWLTGHSCENGLSLLCELKLGRRFEVSGEARFGAAERDGDNLGVYFGRKTLGPQTSFHLHWPQHACIWKGSKELAINRINIDRDNEFHVQRWDNELSTFLNGRQVHVAVHFEGDDDDANAILGLGGQYRQRGSVIQFRNLRVRLLKEQPKKPEYPNNVVTHIVPCRWYRSASFLRGMRLIGVGLLPVLAVLLIALIRKRY